MNNQKYLDEIKRLRESDTIENDPQIIAYVVREWPITKECSLTDLCWAMCQDGFVTKNDAIFILDKLEDRLNVS